jgi:proliferating cell nuclear antigen
MFEIVFKDSKFVKGLFEAVNAIIEETKIEFSPGGISMIGIDSGRICFVGFKLESGNFDDYRCDENNLIGINITDLVKILKRSEKEDTITFKYINFAPDNTKMTVIIKDKKSSKSRSFSLKLVELGDPKIDSFALDNLAYPGAISIPLSYLEEAIKDADIFSETLEISMNETSMLFKAEGVQGECEAELSKTDEGLSFFTCTEHVEGTFALEYLKSILKVSAIADRIELYLDSKSPLKAKFNILSSSKFGYYLAPRIDEVPEDATEE